MNINIFVCILLNELNFKADDDSFEDKINIFQVSIANYSYHSIYDTTIQYYIDPSMIISYRILNNIDPSQLFNRYYNNTINFALNWMNIALQTIFLLVMYQENYLEIQR